EHLAYERLGIVHRQDQDFGRGQCLADLPRRLEAVQVRHADVQDDDVGTQPLRLVARFAPVDGLADELPALLRLEQRAQALADDLVVVGDEDADRLRLHGASGNETLMVAPRSPESTSSEPPSWRTRARMPGNPTPSPCGEFDDFKTSRGMPRP